MKNLAARDVFIGILFAAALVGVALIGLATGHSLRVGDIVALSQHSLFRTGVECLSASAVCAVLLLGGKR